MPRTRRQRCLRHVGQAFLGEEAPVLHPPRLPGFSGRVAHAFDNLPDVVVRNALSSIGNLAAGRPSAFVGMRRLRVRQDICRVRIGSDHRLLFRLHPNHLELLDLNTRRDFERWLQALG